MIQLENVHKSFRKQEVLQGINFEFETGKTNLIIGQSGSGKTVLLKSIIGLNEIDKGTISYDNRIWQEMDRKQQAELRTEMGVVFQGGALFDSMTVAENICYPMEMYSQVSRRQMNKRVLECLDRVNLLHAKKLYPAEISGGMQKRVAIARAIVMKPRYLFCDEPNSGLDPKTAIVIDKLIQEITKENNITTIVNTHDMNSVFEIGEHILFLQNGKIGWTGNRDTIFNSNNENLNELVFASDLYKQIKNSQNQ